MNTRQVRQMLEEIVSGMPDMDDATLQRMVVNELTAIQNRRKEEQKRLQRVLDKQKKQLETEN